MVELVDTRDLKSLDLTVVPVRFRPRAPFFLEHKFKSMLTTSDHSRDRIGYKYIYPVISRRSGGLSIGINLNTNNACNWRCIYCQVPNLTRGSAPPVQLDKLKGELDEFLKTILDGSFFKAEKIPEKLQKIQDIAISGNGEPTTADEFDQVVEIVESVLNNLLLNKTKCILITNGSLVNRDYVKRGLDRLASINGEVWFKIDSATKDGIDRINQVSGTELSTLKRLDIAANHCPTYIQTCVFTYDGENPSDNDKNAYVELLREAIDREIPLKGVLLYGVERPSLLPESSNKIKKLPDIWLSSFAEEIRAIGITVKVSN